MWLPAIKNRQIILEDGIRTGRLDETVIPKGDLLGILRGLDLTVNNHLTNAAVVLFAKKMSSPYSHCEIRMARFKGTTKDIGFLDEKSFVGNAFRILNEAETFVRRHLNIAIEFSQTSMERIETPQLPFLAVREAIINAICHRDYVFYAGSLTLAIYDDRLEIWNMGELQNPLSFEDLKGQHSSVLRNKKIANVFYVRKFIEKWGSGTTRIIKLCHELGVPEPQFHQYSGGFCVTFKFVEPMIPRLPKKEYVKITVRQQQIITILSHHQALSLRDIVEMMPEVVHERLIRDDLYFLKEKHIIGFKGKGRGAKWFVFNEGEIK